MASRESAALPSSPLVFLVGWVYFYEFSFFPPLVFFFFFPPFFLFFPPVYKCLCVLSFRPGWESGSVLAHSNFPPKTWPGGQLGGPPGFPGPRSRAREEFLSQIPGLCLIHARWIPWS